MKRAGGSLLSLLLIVLVVNCQLDVPAEGLTKNTTEDHMNDFTVKAITEFPAYFQTGNNILGISNLSEGQVDLTPVIPVIHIEGKEDEEETTFKAFFTLDGKVYFSILQVFPNETEGEPPIEVIKYCTMLNGVLEYIEEAEFPAIPDIKRAEGTTGDYKLSIGEYNSDPISIASREYDEPMIYIESFFEIKAGLLLNVIEGRLPSRPAGLLLWPNGLQTMDKWKDPGRIWK